MDSTTQKPRLLWIEDRSRPRSDALETLGSFQTRFAGTLAEAREQLREFAADVVLIDSELPDGSGTELLSEIPGSEVLLLTDEVDPGSPIGTLRRRNVPGYLAQWIDRNRLGAGVRRTGGTEGGEEESGVEGTTANTDVDEILGESSPMRELRQQILAVAETDAAVLIVGESGTGKELVAQAIHARSPRRAQPLVAINCGAIPESLIESELFGHEKGAFTGAQRARAGVFERADGGTLLLDEIGEMPADLQVRLLRVLETGHLTRIGGAEAIQVDVRIIAATNREPSEAVADGSLRDDLVYRLAVFPIVIPPLRERGGDIRLLAEHFLERLNREYGTSKTFTDGFLTESAERAWPGNVRELQNAISHAFILAEDSIGAEHFPELTIRKEPRPARVDTVEVPIGSSIADAEKRLVEATLEHTGGDKRRAAKILGISVRTLYDRLRKYRKERGEI